MNEGTTLCGDDQIWVCEACGKTSRTRYGFVLEPNGRAVGHTPDGKRVAAAGWDESCMLNATLCHRVQKPDGTWTAFPLIKDEDLRG